MAIVDISSWQGTIDWAKASKQIELAILRASVGSNKDQKYVEYAEGCRKYGVPYGCYHYLKAHEKRMFIKGYVYSYVYITDVFNSSRLTQITFINNDNVNEKEIEKYFFKNLKKFEV